MTQGVAKLTQEQILAAMIVKELQKNSVIAPTLIDLSSQFAKGKVKAAIPSAGALSVENTPRDGSDVTGSDRQYDNTPLVIDQYKTVADYIYDLDDHESVLDLIADFYADAPQALAEIFETGLVGMMRTYGLASDNKFQLAGTDNQAITLDQVGELNELMTTAKVPKSMRYLAVSPRQARILRSYDEVRHANKFASDEAIRNGFIARLEGFDILESTDLTQYEVMAYHGAAAAYGIGKEVKRDEERQGSKKRTFVSVDGGWGSKVIRDLIWFGNEAAVV